ncbi:MAG: SIS domain-containing protein [Anaerolineaceae bacterium]|nr:SIS domain-containing protein [Anaerolineaceae bacterium]
MGLEQLAARFPNGVLREKHPFYMADAIQDIPGCLQACLSDESLALIQNGLDRFSPHRIFALGCGTSYNACQAAAYACQSMLGIPSVALDAYDFLLDTPPGVDSSALVISISQSGQSLTTCLAQEKARQQGAATVCQTGKPGSRLTAGADLSLIDPYLLEIPLGKTRSYLSSALQAMLVGVMTAAPARRVEFIQDAKAMVDQIRASMTSWEKSGQTIAAEWAGRTTHYVMTGFGIQLANAHEIALKLIEVISEGATGFGLEEFTHGVHGCFRQDLGVILFHTDARALERAVRVANGVVMSEASIVVITDQPEAGWPEKARLIELPRLGNAQQLGLFPAAAAAHHLLYSLAMAKGLNPDVNSQNTHPELGDIYRYFFPPGSH